MEPERTALGIGRKKFYIITLCVFVGLLILASTFVFLKQKNAKQITGSQNDAVPLQKVFTEEEKLRVLYSIATSTPKDTQVKQAEKLRLLEEFTKKTSKDSAASTAEKLKLLQSMTPNTNQ